MGMILLVVFLLQGINGDGESVGRTLDYLARHQAEDGSWGRRPDGCTCPLEPPEPLRVVDEPTRAKAAALISRFNDDDPEVRAQAQRDLVALGPAALPVVREAEAAGSPEVRMRCRAVLSAVQPALTAPDLELTALSLYLINEAGYHSQVPRRAGEIPYGSILQRGEAWLLARQNGEGRIGPGDAAAHAIATLALADELTMSHRPDLKEPVRKGLDYIAAHRGEGRRAIFWQIAALAMGKMGELHVGDEVWADLSGALVRLQAEPPFSAAVAASSHLVTIYKDHRRPDVSAEWTLSLPPSRVEPETAYLLSCLAWQLDGNKGPKWAGWIRSLESRLRPRRLAKGCGAGAWPADGTPDRLRQAVWGGLAQQFFYAR
jgi:hypothetical protein